MSVPHGIDRSGAAGGSGAQGLTGSLNDLSDPNADRILFWDDSAGALAWLTPSNGVGIVGTTISVADYGASGDGVTDDTSAFTAALALAAGTGGIVYVPEGVYKITSQLIVDNCVLRGVGTYDWDDTSSGSMFHLTDTVAPAFSLKQGGQIIGCNFYYPDQVTTASPTVYPATVEMFQSGAIKARLVRVEKCHFVNSYHAIDCAGDTVTPSGPWFRIQDNHICAINVGISHLYSAVECWINHNNFTYALWAAAAAADIRQTISSNAIAITVGDVDGLNIDNNTIFGFAKGIDVSLTPAILRITNNTIDRTYHCIDLDDVGAAGEIQVSGNMLLAKNHNDTLFDARCISISWGSTTGKSAFLNITGNTFGVSNGDHISHDGSNSANDLTLNVSGNLFMTPGATETSAAHYAVDINDTSNANARLVCHGNFFTNTTNKASNLLTGVRFIGQGASITGNYFQSYNTNIDISGMNAATFAVVEGNLSLTEITNAVLFPVNMGQNIIGNNRWGSQTQGATKNVASATTVTLPNSDTGFYFITGSTNITSITASWPHRKVTLVFAQVLTVTDGSNLVLAGDFITSGNDALTLVCDGASWYEVSRSAN